MDDAVKLSQTPCDGGRQTSEAIPPPFIYFGMTQEYFFLVFIEVQGFLFKTLRLKCYRMTTSMLPMRIHIIALNASLDSLLFFPWLFAVI